MSTTTRRVMMVLTAVTMVIATLVGLNALSRVQAANTGPQIGHKLELDNVRAYLPAASPEAKTYAVDGGMLYAGQPLDWNLVSLPEGVIAGAVAVDSHNPEAVYVGAANELAIYRSLDGGANWLYVPLTDEHVGGVKDIAFDSETRLMYVATDTAGVFRLRDVGSSITSGGHFAVDAPVVEIETDSTGAAMAFFRTADTLYRSENGGLSWNQVTTLNSVPTSIAIANSKPPVVYVGTTDRGVLRSDTGVAWMTSNDGLGMAPGVRLHVDALEVDPQQAGVLYVATSVLNGSTSIHQTPTGVAMSANGGSEWAPIVRGGEAPVAELLPVAGVNGAVYALTTTDRSPLALGMAPVAPRVEAVTPAPAGALAYAGAALAWLVALLSAAWLVLLVAAESRTAPAPVGSPAMQMARTGR